MWTPIRPGTPSTCVVHCKDSRSQIYIGRASDARGKWGNPYKIDANGNRLTVIEKHKTWLLTQPQLLQTIPDLRGKYLGCWCKKIDHDEPINERNVCHGDTLAAFADGKNCIRTAWDIFIRDLKSKIYICSCGYTTLNGDDWHWRDIATISGTEIQAAMGGYLPSFPMTPQQRQEFWEAWVQEGNT